MRNIYDPPLCTEVVVFFALPDLKSYHSEVEELIVVVVTARKHAGALSA